MEFYKYQILKYRNIDINYDIGLKWYCTIIVLMIDVQTDITKHLPFKNETPWNKYGKNIGV